MEILVFKKFFGTNLKKYQPQFFCCKLSNHSKAKYFNLINNAKGSTDLLEQKITFYLSKTKFQKWITIAFSYFRPQLHPLACPLSLQIQTGLTLIPGAVQS